MNAGVKDSSQSSSPKSDIVGENRHTQKFNHSYFWNGVRSSMEMTPPTPPPSSKVDTVVPRTGDVNGRRKSASSSLVLTPPSLTMKREAHLNDDYSNLYYSEEDDDDEEEEDERLEMGFGKKKVTK